MRAGSEAGKLFYPAERLVAAVGLSLFPSAWPLPPLNHSPLANHIRVNLSG